MNNWSFKWITDWTQIWSDDFLRQWGSWMDQSWSSHVFFHPALVRAWVETYRQLWDIEPLFLVATHDGTTAFLPLLLWKRNWKNALLKEIIPVGYSDFDYHDPIISGQPDDFDMETFWDAVIAELKKNGTAFDRIHLSGITKKVAGSGNSWQEDDICPYCDISIFKNPDEYLPSLSKKHRGELRRRLRRLGEHGDLTYRVYSKDDFEATRSILPHFLSTHAARWPNAYKAPYFHENLLRFGLPAGVIHFSELCLNDKVISWRIGLIDSCRYYSYMPAYDPNFSTFSPGQVHLLKCIEEAIRLRLKIYDNLRGEEAYKSGWINNKIQLYTLSVMRKPLRSRTKCFLADQIKPKLAAFLR